MKYFIFLLLVNFLFISCQSSSEDSYDDKLLECFYAHHEDGGKLAKQQFQEFEQMMVDKGILASSNGEEYYALNQNILEKSGFPADLFEKIDDELREKALSIGGFICRDENILEDTVAMNSSRLHRYTLVMEDIHDTGELSWEAFSKGISKRFTSKDFDHPLLKRAFITFIFTWLPADKGLKMKLPPWSNEEIDPTSLNKRNVFSVLVNKDNKLLVRGEEIKIPDLKEKAKEFILNPNKRDNLAISPAKAIISLRNDRGTNYKIYLKVLNELKAAYNEIWTDIAMEKYGVPYDDELPREYKKEIQKMVPLIISEAEPVD